MQELPEELVRAIWMKLGEQSEEEVLGDLQRMQEEQAPAMTLLLNEPADASEYAREIVLHLGLMVCGSTVPPDLEMTLHIKSMSNSTSDTFSSSDLRGERSAPYK